MSKIKNGGFDQYGKVYSLNGIGGERVKGQRCQLVTLCHPGLAYIRFNF